TFQVGANANETISFTLGDMSAASLKGTSALATATGVAITAASGSGTTLTPGTITSAGTITVNGTNVNIAAGASASDIASAINTNVSGVSATVDDNDQLVLTSSKAIDFTPPSGAANDLADDLGLTTAEATVTTSYSSVEDLSIATAAGAQSATQVIDEALKQIDSQRSALGAVQNRLDSTLSNLQNVAESSTAARSTIQDVDFASETAEMTKQQTLQQAATAVLAQANQLPSAVMKLLG
ncbi:flagellin, partial [Pseudomonas sp.]|uniref:flagellin n=1 Tax=Pseudomonas sp. TaxID=306 RepID=UPI00289650AB